MDDLSVPVVPDYAHRVAMYDMDRTITRAGTYSGFLMHVVRRRQQWRMLLTPLVGLAGAAYTLGLIDRSRLKAINLWLLIGPRFRRDEIAPLAESYADRVVARGLHPAALGSHCTAVDGRHEFGSAAQPAGSAGSMMEPAPGTWKKLMYCEP